MSGRLWALVALILFVFYLLPLPGWLPALVYLGLYLWLEEGRIGLALLAPAFFLVPMGERALYLDSFTLALRESLVLWGASVAISGLDSGRPLYLAPLFFVGLVLRPEGSTLALELWVWLVYVYAVQAREALRAGARARLVVLAFALLLGLFAVAIGPIHFSLPHPTAGVAGQAAAPNGLASTPSPPSAGGRGPGLGQGPVRVYLPAWLPQLMLFLGIVGLVSFLLLARRTPGQGRTTFRGRRDGLWSLVLGLLGLTFWLFATLIWRPDTEGHAVFTPLRPIVTLNEQAPGETSAEERPAKPTDVPEKPQSMPPFWPIAALILFLAVYLAWRWRQEEGKGGRKERVSEPSRAPPNRVSPAPGRVRAAYRRFLRAARRVTPRRAVETPREYAHRFARARPELAEAAFRLTELYEPVRYGGAADLAHAEEAELLAEEIERRLR